jgi:carboxyl-terminal processing protease
MNQKTTRKIAKVIAFLLIGALVVTSFTFVFSFAESPDTAYTPAEEAPDWDKEFSFMKDLILKTKAGYKDFVSYRSLIDGANKGIIDSLKDPYSTFYLSEAESLEFQESVSGEFSGVGVSLEKIGELCKVVAPIPLGPAEAAGVKSGDFIIKVDGVDVKDLPLSKIAEMLRGKEGTKVDMTVTRDGKILTFSLVREKIRLSSITYQLLDEGKIGYIKISQFDSDSHLEFKEARLKLTAEGATSFIVDVRNNPGGYVGTAAGIAEQLMPKGAIVHFQKQDTIINSIVTDGKGSLRIPTVLLINEGSASASEILAAAWKDSGTATLVGTRTYGKGVAQQIIPTAGEAKVKLSMYYFISPNKNQIDKVGVSPDYLVKNYEGSDEEIARVLYDEYKSFAPMSEEVKPKLGELGLNVYGAQQRLSLLGYDNAISGVLDLKTSDCIKDFQKNKGLYPYGVLDYSTMSLLDKEALEYVIGAKGQKDLQLEKAVELLKLGQASAS